MKKFWAMSNLSGEIGQILLYGDIGDDFWSEVNSREFNRDLQGMGDVGEIVVRINSPGGCIFAGLAIYNSLKRHKAKITIHIDGLCASMASVIAMAGDVIYMPRTGLLMIHSPWGEIRGTSDDLRDQADAMDKMRDCMVDAYMTRVTISEEELRGFMNTDTWLSADEALEYGFITEIENLDINASVKGSLLIIKGQSFDMSRFKNFPNFSAKLGLNSNLNNTSNTNEEEHMTREELQAKYPDVYSSIYNSGVEDERSRIQALDSINFPGSEEIVAAAKYTTFSTKAEVAVQLVDNQPAVTPIQAQAPEPTIPQTGAQALAARMADAKNAGLNGVTGSATGPTLNPEEEKLEKAKARAARIAAKANQ